MKTYRIAVIAGDGIGKEVIPAGIDVLRMAADQGGFRLDFTDVPWGCDYYLQTGRMMDADGVSQLLKFDAIYLGAIGDPRVSDAISARELILPLRQRLGQYVNLRPMRLMPGISSPLANRGAADIDMICVRENSEGEYCGIGGRLHGGTPQELADMQFAWSAVKHIKSNAIVIVKDGATVGIGGGQVDRVGASRIAIEKASASPGSSRPSGIGLVRVRTIRESRSRSRYWLKELAPAATRPVPTIV